MQFLWLFGHKPTFGRIPAYPISPFGTIANLGPISRTVKDSGVIMNAIANLDIQDWHSLPNDKQNYIVYEKENIKKLKIGYSKYWGMHKYFDSNLMDSEILESIEDAIFSLKKNRLQISEIGSINWPHNPLEVLVMWQSGAANLARKISKKDYRILSHLF